MKSIYKWHSVKTWGLPKHPLNEYLACYVSPKNGMKKYEVVYGYEMENDTDYIAWAEIEEFTEER